MQQSAQPLLNNALLNNDGFRYLRA